MFSRGEVADEDEFRSSTSRRPALSTRSLQARLVVAVPWRWASCSRPAKRSRGVSATSAPAVRRCAVSRETPQPVASVRRRSPHFQTASPGSGGRASARHCGGTRHSTAGGERRGRCRRRRPADGRATVGDTEPRFPVAEPGADRRSCRRAPCRQPAQSAPHREAGHFGASNVESVRRVSRETQAWPSWPRTQLSRSFRLGPPGAQGPHRRGPRREEGHSGARNVDVGLRFT